MAIIYGNELYHHGILGQKWGIRRYQNEDGSLTEEGRTHYGYTKKLADKIRSLNPLKKKTNSNKVEVKKTNTKESSNKTKSISEMSDEELVAYTKRSKLEADAYKAANDLNNLKPKQTTLGEKFTSELIKVAEDKLLPAAIEVGKQYLQDYIKSQQPESEISKLKKEKELTGLHADIAKNKLDYYNSKTGLDHRMESDKAKEDSKTETKQSSSGNKQSKEPSSESKSEPKESTVFSGIGNSYVSDPEIKEYYNLGKSVVDSLIDKEK